MKMKWCQNIIVDRKEVIKVFRNKVMLKFETVDQVSVKIDVVEIIKNSNM